MGLIHVEHLVPFCPDQRESDVVGDGAVLRGHGERLVVALRRRQWLVEGKHPRAVRRARRPSRGRTGLRRSGARGPTGLRRRRARGVTGRRRGVAARFIDRDQHHGQSRVLFGRQRLPLLEHRHQRLATVEPRVCRRAGDTGGRCGATEWSAELFTPAWIPERQDVRDRAPLTGLDRLVGVCVRPPSPAQAGYDQDAERSRNRPLGGRTLTPARESTEEPDPGPAQDQHTGCRRQKDGEHLRCECRDVKVVACAPGMARALQALAHDGLSTSQ